MNCEEVKRDLVAFLDKELSPEESRQVEEHLASCQKCREETALLARASDLLDRWEEVKASPDFTATVLSRLPVAGRRPAILSRRWFKFALPLAAAAVILLAVGIYNYHIERPPKELINNLELLENYELLENFDLLVEMDVLQELHLVGEEANGV